ncbi:MAG: OadG family protein [Candidatus Gastranaerophilales bacterium]|nr:OadG family protein [Candidatus Gastranaerophilales bacterium]
MKKWIALVCMITCIFGLTACGKETVWTEYEQQKVSNAEKEAVDTVIPVFLKYAAQADKSGWDELTAEEIAYAVAMQDNLLVDGYAFRSGVESFESALDTIGAVSGTGSVETQIDDDQIIVHVQVQGAQKNAEAEVIFSNDIFLNLESVALNPESSMGELMGKAVLNTVIGMGTVFVVLILISLIISCFKIIPSIQAKFEAKKQKDQPAPAASEAPQAVEEIVEESDDLELVAVIAAAVAASEGVASADGFVVRSIRKVNRARR